MVARFEIVRMIFDVGFALAAILKEHLAANVMKRTPLFVVVRRLQFVLSFDHLRCGLDFGPRFQYLLPRSIDEFNKQHE